MKKNIIISSSAIIIAFIATIIPIVITFQLTTTYEEENDNSVDAVNYSDITVEIAFNMINDRENYTNLVVVDVRTISEYQEGHINNSIIIPYDELNSRIHEIEEYKHHEIIVYCRSGRRSAIAAEILISNNFTSIYNMFGGINAWVLAGYPIV